ncbi:hypothetical protein BDV25DRAFT_117166 [Aspergillus avenaceus]|uniref:Branchpoint-bridging protein n=1 Tax=Aspergillus avenaceus TaxID=36643 RepID=A0A5N6TUU9_ASPAV|nr:hypothetical protein BDV25DRAFT_117166 [Aspergillus avenaceus]
MAWRNQGITGSNNVPLGRRRFGGDDPGDDESRTATPSSLGDHKRGRSPVRAEPPVDGVKKRKKRNRWGDAQENKAAGLMGLPTMIMANFTNEQLEAYTLHLRIEEISQKLRINDVVPADGDRSPSPPPQYDNFGRRVNTREYRYRKRLEDERHKLVEKAMKTIPNYHPPSDYRRPTKTQEKVYVPVNDYPEINFIGLLIGPRGNTLKKMETESGAKIAIRGKGSVKEGKGRSDAAHASNQEEDLHCLIMADTEEKVNKAKKLVHNVIETAASIPEGQNELKRNQLRELAALNGTLRDDENQACQNCKCSLLFQTASRPANFRFFFFFFSLLGGQIGHRKYDCPEQRNFTANIICRVCGNAGHMARDCPDRQRGTDWRNNAGYGGGRRAIGGGDAVDREMEVSYTFLANTEALTNTAHSNLCKNCLEVLLAKMVTSLAVLKLVPTRVMTTAMSSHGSGDPRLATSHHGSSAAGIAAVTTTDRVTKEAQLHGHKAVVAIMAMALKAVTELLVLLLHLGSSKLRPHHLVDRLPTATVLMVDMLLLFPEWALLALLAWVYLPLHRACHLCIMALAAVLHLHLLLVTALHLHLPAISRHLLPHLLKHYVLVRWLFPFCDFTIRIAENG